VKYRAPDWEREGLDWPNRDASRFVQSGGLRWHVQIMGQGPVLLLVHGTGSATHSWRNLAPRLAERFTVVAPDLPGHGFTQSPPKAAGLSLPGMASGLARLLDALGTRPDLAVGHSAGAAIVARLCLDGAIAPRALVSLNGALLPLRGLAAHWFAPAARIFVSNPLLIRVFAWRAQAPDSVERLFATTGSRLEPDGIKLYRRLISTPSHVASTLGMMANWDLMPLGRDLPALRTPLVLVAAERDGTIRPADAQKVEALVPGSEVIGLPNAGHLAHEEQPRLVAELIERIAGRYGPAT
jgi:magnesium chelatase accessory protein